MSTETINVKLTKEAEKKQQGVYGRTVAVTVPDKVYAVPKDEEIFQQRIKDGMLELCAGEGKATVTTKQPPEPPEKK